VDRLYALSCRQLLPLPAAEDYLVKRRRKEKAEELHEASGRRRNTVTFLLEAGVIEPNTALKLNLSAFSAEEQAIIEPEVESNPEVGLAEWTGLGLHKALRWRVDNKVYSATGLIKHILSLHGCGLHALPGPRYWRVPGEANFVGDCSRLGRRLRGRGNLKLATPSRQPL
jgi:hypothetical protein